MLRNGEENTFLEIKYFISHEIGANDRRPTGVHDSENVQQMHPLPC